MPADNESAQGQRATARGPSTVRKGTMQVGLGLAFFGLSTYAFTAVVLRALGPGQFAEFNSFWGLTYGVGLGAMMPFEQEVSRRTVTARHLGEPASQILTAGLQASCLLAVVLALATIPFALGSGHHNPGALWVATAASFLGLGIAYVSRGSLAGTGRFHVYGAQLVAEGVVRLLAVGALFVVGASAPWSFALVVPVALVLAVGVTWRRDWRPMRPPRGLARAVAASTVPLVVSSMVSLTLVNLGPVAVRYVGRIADPTRDGSYLAAAFIARLPIFLFAAVQAVLVPRLTRAVVLRDLGDFRRSLKTVLLLTVALGAVSTLGVAVMGPRLLVLLAGSQYRLPVGDMVLLTAALGCYLTTLVLQPAAVALGRHRSTSAIWLLGGATFGVAWLLPGAATAAVSLAIALVCLVVSTGLALTVRRGLRELRPPMP